MWVSPALDAEHLHLGQTPAINCGGPAPSHPCQAAGAWSAPDANGHELREAKKRSWDRAWPRQLLKPAQVCSAGGSHPASPPGASVPRGIALRAWWDPRARCGCGGLCAPTESPEREPEHLALVYIPLPSLCCSGRVFASG